MSKNKNLEVRADFYGLKTFQKALREVDPDLAKELRKSVRAPMQKVYNSARRLVAQADIPSGWRQYSNGPKGWGDPTRKGWNNSKVRSGIKLREGGRTVRGVKPLYRIMNQSAAGNIYEFAKNPKTAQGVSFVRKLNEQRPSRLIWRAYDEAGGDRVIMSEVQVGIEAVYAEFEQRMKNVPRSDRIGIG